MATHEHTAPRRAFLRQLAALPLIGGAVSIIGAPSAVAEPVTRSLAMEYASWLGFEHDRICYELRGKDYRDLQQSRWYSGAAYDWHKSWHRAARSDDLFDFRTTDASTRAALVLSTVGCDWRT